MEIIKKDIKKNTSQNLWLPSWESSLVTLSSGSFIVRGCFNS